MANYVLLIDPDKCNGCHNCFIACKDEHIGVSHLPWSPAVPEGTQLLRMHSLEHGSGDKIKVDFCPFLCRHCAQPACAAAMPEAVEKRKDGIVGFDPVRAAGQRVLADACPYGAVSWDAALGQPLKCTLCVHMLEDGEKTTRCAESCPTGALVFGDLDDPDSPVSRLLALPENARAAACGDAVRYLRLPSPFLAGEALRIDVPDCAEDVAAVLTCQATGEQLETRTDFFGDFQFTGLCAGETYTLELRLSGYAPCRRTVTLQQSTNLGTLFLTPCPAV